MPEILDYKFNKDSRYWKSQRQLHEDVQVNAYALAVGLPLVRVSHVPFTTRAPWESRKVTTVLNRTNVVKLHEKQIYPSVEKIIAVREQQECEQVAVDLTGCRAFGGCPFESRCTKRIGGAKPMGVLQDLIEKRKAAAAVIPGAQAVQNVMQQNTIGGPAVKATFAGKPLGPPTSGATIKIPPTAPPARAAARRLPPPGHHFEGSVLVPDQIEESAPGEAPETPEEAVGAAVASSLARGPITRTTAGLTLTIDCIVKLAGEQVVQSLDGYLVDMTATVAEHFGVEDIRTAPNDSPLAYGKWRGFLTAAIRSAPPEPGEYLITGAQGSELKQCLIEALEPYCDRVTCRG